MGACRGRLSGWEDGPPALTATAAQLPVATGAGAAGTPESYVPLLLLLLGSLKLWAQLPWSEGWDCRQAPIPLFPRFCLLYFSSPTFRCTDVWTFPVLLCLAEEPLLSCGRFTRYRSKGKDKGSFPLHHVSDVTL